MKTLLAGPWFVKTLLAGPWFGELGWEIATWVPTVRAAGRHYERTVVVCQPGHHYLYQDFAREFVIEHRGGLQDRWMLDWKEHKPQASIREKYPEADILYPTKESIYHGAKAYHKYGTETNGVNPEANVVLLHARTERHAESENRNWAAANYDALVSMLHRSHPDTLIFSVGSRKGAAHVENTGDLRDIPLIVLCQQMHRAKVIAGPSSGPMHLASFCGLPHVVWTTAERRKAIGGTNRDRYERLWNPLQTHCTIIDKWDWQPPVEPIYNAVKEYLK